jgi:hypothetical protein
MAHLKNISAFSEMFSVNLNHTPQKTQLRGSQRQTQFKIKSSYGMMGDGKGPNTA